QVPVEEGASHASTIAGFYFLARPGPVCTCAPLRLGGNFAPETVLFGCGAHAERREKARAALVVADDPHRPQAQIDAGADRRPGGDVLHRVWFPAAGHS